MNINTESNDGSYALHPDPDLKTVLDWLDDPRDYLVTIWRALKRSENHEPNSIAFIESAINQLDQKPEDMRASDCCRLWISYLEESLNESFVKEPDKFMRAALSLLSRCSTPQTFPEGEDSWK